jgi:hypothetical protein
MKTVLHLVCVLKTHMYTYCGYGVSEMNLLRELKGPMRLDHSNDMSAHVSTCTSYDLNAVTPVVCKLWRW